jgi:hypothetical protein
MRGPNIEKIGRVSREIEGRVWDMGAKRTEHGGGLDNVSGGCFSSCVVKVTIWQGRGRIWMPVNVMVSVLDIILLEGGHVE